MTGHGEMDDIALQVPGLPVLTASRILEWYDGPLCFRATAPDGAVWIASWVDRAIEPEHPPDVDGFVGWTRYADRWAYMRHDAATVDAIARGERPYRDVYTAASEWWRVDLVWTSTAGPQHAGDPVVTATRATIETIHDGWLPDEHFTALWETDDAP